MKIRAFSVESTEIEISEVDYLAHKKAGTLGDALDAPLSDLDGETFLIEPDGSVVSPYGVSVEQISLTVGRLMNSIPAEDVWRYLVARMTGPVPE